MFAPKTTASSRFNLHSALRLRNALHFYPHIGIKSHAQVAAFYEFKPLSIMYLLAQFIRLSLIIRIDGGRCVKKRGKNIFFYIADMSRVFAHAVKNIENMPVMKL